MADPSATITRKPRNYEGLSKAKLVGSEDVVAGAFAAELFSSGELQNLAAEAGAWPTGVITGPTSRVTVDSDGAWTGTNLNTDADPGASVQGDLILTGLTVAGAASYAKKGEPVFGTDGQTLTITRPGTDAVPMGFVWDMPRAHTAATDIEVFIFGKATSWLLSSAGGNKRRIILGTLPMATIANGSTISQALWGHGRITKIGCNPIIDITTASKAATFTGDIGGVAITTGAISLVSASLATPGTEQAVSPTAANEFHDGDVFSGVFSAVTAFGEGTAYFFIDVEYLPGA